MGVIQNIRKALGYDRGEKSISPGVTGLPYGGPYRYFDLQGFIHGEEYRFNYRDFDTQLKQGFGINPYVYAVVSYIARTYASLPRDWYRTPDGYEPVERPTGNLLQANNLLNAPSWKYTNSDLYEAIAIQLLVTGNAIVYGQVAPGFTRPTELMVAPTDIVEIQTDNGNLNGKPIFYEILDVGTIPAEDVLHIRYTNPIEQTYWGLSPLHPGQTVFEASNNTFAAQASVHKNQGVSGVLSPKNSDMPLMPDEQDKLQRTWDIKNGGPDKVGKVHVTTQSVEYTRLGLDPTQLRLLEHNLEALRDICRIYGIPPQLFGDPAASTYNNMKEAKKSFYTDVLLPLSEKIDKALGSFLLRKFNVSTPYYLCLSTDQIEILNQVETELSSKVIAEVQSGILPASEALAILYPEIAERTANEADESI